jgi:mono/diheme cytochrome c family protein
VVGGDNFTANAPNITPDRETGIGAWTDAQIITAIREGRRPNGTLIGPPMPIGMYRMMSDPDVHAIVAYLRQVTPVHNAVAATTYPFPLPSSYGKAIPVVGVSPASPPVIYGRYLSTALGHCMECHSAPGKNGPDVVNGLGEGGMRFPGPWGVSTGSNLTPNGIGVYSDAELKTIITTGVRPNGSHLLPPMGTAYYAHMTDHDVSAIVAYLRTLPPK